MQNIEYMVDQKTKKLIITIDLKKKGTPSKSGKSLVIASTQGNADIGRGIKLGINCYKPASQKVLD